MVPVSTGHTGLPPGQGLADAAWEDREPSTRAETQSPVVTSDQCSAADQVTLDTVETRVESGQ